MSLTGSEISIIQHQVSSIDKTSNFRSKTRTPKNKNLNFQNFLSSSITRIYKISAKKNARIFGSKLHTHLIMGGSLFLLPEFIPECCYLGLQQGT
jgi:hypothetical protein